MEIDSWFHVDRSLEHASANVLNAAFVAQVRARVLELHDEHNHRTKRLLSLGEDIAHLWDDLNVPEEDRHAFSSSVHSLSEETLHAGEQELARLRAQMGTYQDLVSRGGGLWMAHDRPPRADSAGKVACQGRRVRDGT